MFRTAPNHLCFPFMGVLVLVSLLGILPAFAQQSFMTPKAVVYFHAPADLLKMEGRLRFTQAEGFMQRYFYTQDPAQTSLAPGLAAKIDGLLTRVSLILNIWPPNPNRLRIFLLQDGHQVRQRHLALQPLQERPIFGYSPMSGFYESRTRSIFISLKDLHEGILAHEMTHFILCESFAVAPPASLQEEWARYVETRIY